MNKRKLRILKNKKLKEIQKRTSFNNWVKEFEREKTLWEKIKIYFLNIIKWK